MKKWDLSLGTKISEEIAASNSDLQEEVNQQINQLTKYPNNQTNNQEINRRQTLACRSVSHPVLCYSIAA
jgi:hypothetical protein